MSYTEYSMYTDDSSSDEEDQINVVESEATSLEDDAFDVDSFFMEAKHSLSIPSVENESRCFEADEGNRRASLFSVTTGRNGIEVIEESESAPDISTVPFQEFAVRYVNKYLVTDLLYKKSIPTWDHSCHVNEMKALPEQIRAMLKVKNLKLGPLMRLLVIKSIHERIEYYRDRLPIDILTEEKDEILAGLMARDFNDDEIWTNTLKCILEAGFVAKTEISPYNPNRMSFEEKLDTLKDENLVQEGDASDGTFICPRITFNISNMKRHNGYYRASNIKRHKIDELLVFDPMVKQRMNAKLRSYNSRNGGQIPKFTKLEFEQNINLNHPLIPHLRNLRNPRHRKHIAGEQNACLLFNIDQYQTLEEEWIDSKKNLPITGIGGKSEYSHFHAPTSHSRFRRLSSITGSYYLGYDQKLFCHDSYRQWVFKSVHFKRIAAYMYAQELSTQKKIKEEKNWPCIVYDLNILNLPFKAAGKDFIQTWLCTPQDETDEGFVYLPGLKEQYQAMVIEKLSQEEYLRIQSLKRDLGEPEDDVPHKIVLNFDF
ncbi:uncharacterized protein KLLA0_E15203g [Kluyveromyces lactis]|uniref:KLLA0E15203p n=1 Tax=Kluyveromyces lactis (strain ATCC 8585 / CBS 2359 / DSM 70799 / NBRC 1267 / NRRL Y-1140 / WM37) TaxID=284590 RepID=Q6CN54_KLULA|nr:uncharacterized protein KLLA0_E15203g [Kluyveromyces lactis]CAG99722.1 KLLA0E15203p [Kluyveromyces lactis]|eukprot:XP_454635.1 uncharacterized protein KLLA0_E15203g [Kluyveromyces lactis]